MSAIRVLPPCKDSEKEPVPTSSPRLYALNFDELRKIMRGVRKINSRSCHMVFWVVSRCIYKCIFNEYMPWGNEPSQRMLHSAGNPYETNFVLSLEISSVREESWCSERELDRKDACVIKIIFVSEDKIRRKDFFGRR